MRLILITFLFTFLFSVILKSQDSTYIAPKLTKAIIVSSTLMTAGIITNEKGIKQDFQEWVRNQYNVSQSSIDDYLQHLPIAMLYTADLLKGTDKREVGRHTRHLITSEIFSIGTALLLKELVNNTRPNGGSHSFPSGHTAHAFTGATVFYLSMREEHPILAYAGFIPASLTGAYRMIKDKHWVSDVLFGAGLGILSATLVYELDVWKSRTKTRESKGDFSFQLGFTPAGLGVTLNW